MWWLRHELIASNHEFSLLSMNRIALQFIVEVEELANLRFDSLTHHAFFDKLLLSISEVRI